MHRHKATHKIKKAKIATSKTVKIKHAVNSLPKRRICLQEGAEESKLVTDERQGVVCLRLDSEETVTAHRFPLSESKRGCYKVDRYFFREVSWRCSIKKWKL